VRGPVDSVYWVLQHTDRHGRGRQPLTSSFDPLLPNKLNALNPLVRPVNFHRDLVRQPGCQSVNLTKQRDECRAVL
jgi:hypothetical protein